MGISGKPVPEAREKTQLTEQTATEPEYSLREEMLGRNRGPEKDRSWDSYKGRTSTAKLGGYSSSCDRKCDSCDNGLC